MIVSHMHCIHSIQYVCNICNIHIVYILKEAYIYIYERSKTKKIGVERVNQEKHLVEFVLYITLADNQQ